MRIISGADGCKGGWVVVSKDLDSLDITWRKCQSANDLFSLEPIPQVIAIDIPIGLPDKGARDCDLEARQRLGQGRASSVFPAPIRPILGATGYTSACEIGFRTEAKKISRQTWAIVPKIRDVDAALQQDAGLRTSVREVHPEVCFYFLAGERSMAESKKSVAGQIARHKLLYPTFGDWLDRALTERSGLASTIDDVLDAFVALWTAERIVGGRSITLPAEPPRDRFGLRMEMVA